MIAEELQAAGVVGRDQHLQKQPAEQRREDLYGQKIAGPARDPPRSVRRQAAARHDHVHMRVVGERGTPGVQHRHEANASAEMLWISRNREGGLGRGFEQQVVDHRLVLIGDVGDWCRQCVHDVEVRHRQQLGFALGQPFAGGSALTLRAVPVAAAIVGDDGVSAVLVLAAPDMAAERRRAAALDRAHYLHLVEADVPGIGLPPCRPVVAEDVRDLQLWTGHGRGLLCRRLVLLVRAGLLARLLARL
jgi:hypothetical protein